MALQVGEPKFEPQKDFKRVVMVSTRNLSAVREKWAHRLARLVYLMRFRPIKKKKPILRYNMDGT